MDEFIRVIRNNNYISIIDFGANCKISYIIDDFIKNKKSPLWYMVKNDKEFNEYVFSYLMDVYEADIDTTNEEGQTLLMYCIEKGYLNMIDMLISNDCDINLQDNVGMSALHYSVYNLDSNLVRLLLLSGIDIKLKDNCGQTALDYLKNNFYHQHIDDPDKKKYECYDTILKKVP
jgi:ankyrin repeat protein